MIDPTDMKNSVDSTKVNECTVVFQNMKDSDNHRSSSTSTKLER